MLQQRKSWEEPRNNVTSLGNHEKRKREKRRTRRFGSNSFFSSPHILSSSLHSWSRGPSCGSSVPVQIVLVFAQLQFALAQLQLQYVLVEFKYNVKLKLVLVLVQLLVQKVVQALAAVVQLNFDYCLHSCWRGSECRRRSSCHKHHSLSFPQTTLGYSTTTE